MKPVVIDVNVFLDLIKLQMTEWLFAIGFRVYTTQEIIDQLNETQFQLLKEFIESNRLVVYRMSEKELNDATGLTAIRSLELSDKSVVWLALKQRGTVISDNPMLKRLCQARQIDVAGMKWFFDQLIEKEFITYVVAAQKIDQLLKVNRRIARKDFEKQIKD